MKKKFALILLFQGTAFFYKASACEVCKKNQPELLEDITHGAGPQNNFDYIITWTALVFVLLVLILSVKYLIRPGEKQKEHIKHRILNNN